MPRWTVVTPRNGFEDVGADELSITGGALVFTDGDPVRVTVAYAPTAWSVVTLDEED